MSAKNIKATVGEPHDRLTHLADILSAKLEEHDPEVKAIIFLAKGPTDRGAVIHGYEQPQEMADDLADHVVAAVRGFQ